MIVVDLTTLPPRQTEPIPVGDAPVPLARTADGTRLYVSRADGRVVAVDAVTSAGITLRAELFAIRA